VVVARIVAHALAAGQTRPFGDEEDREGSGANSGSEIYLLVNWPHNEANQHAELVRSSQFDREIIVLGAVVLAAQIQLSVSHGNDGRARHCSGPYDGYALD
jgi:hypothetical protein